MRNKGRKLVIGGASIIEKSDESSANNHKIPPQKEVGQPPTAHASHPTTTNGSSSSSSSNKSNAKQHGKLSIIAAYLTPLKNVGPYASACSPEAKPAKPLKVKKTPRVWTEVLRSNVFLIENA